MSRSLPDEAYTEGQCDIHGQVLFVDIMGDDFCVQCFADQQRGHTHIECFSQDKVEAVIKANNLPVVRTGSYSIHGKTVIRALGDATIEAYDTVIVFAYDNALVVARNEARVWAGDNTEVTAYDSAKVWARNNAKVDAFDSASADAQDNVVVRLYDDATMTTGFRTSFPEEYGLKLDSSVKVID